MTSSRHIPLITKELNLQKKIVYESLIEGVSEALKSKKKEIRLCEVKNLNHYITVEKKDWKDGLKNALKYYEIKEEYEECSKIKSLIDKL